MTEMTWKEAVESCALMKECGEDESPSVKWYDQIVAIIEQQATEIAKKDRMLGIVINAVKNRACPFEFPCVKKSYPNFECRECWLAWLEKEAQGEAE